MDYLVKVGLGGAAPDLLTLARQKTMYGGKTVAAGDRLFVIDSETSGGAGLVAWGVVEEAVDAGRGGTPRVTVRVAVRGRVKRRFGRAEVKGFTDWADGRPETEVNFKFYRQATDKLAGITAGTAGFLAGFF